MISPTEVLVSDICEAIATTLATASGIKAVRSIKDIGERVAATDCPCLHVYPERYTPNMKEATDRHTFKGGIRKSKLTVHVDHFPRKMSHMGLDLQAMVTGLDTISAVLESQSSQPFFGLSVIKAFNWSWKRGVLKYTDGAYRGGRFTLELYIF